MSLITNNYLNEVWNSIINTRNGFYKKLLNTHDSFPYLFVTADFPSGNFGIAISLPSELIINLSRFETLRDLRINQTEDSTFQNRILLCITLLQNTYIDIFSVLCADLINMVVSESSGHVIYKLIINQLEKWRSIFDRINVGGLSRNEQHGLYGELKFLTLLLKHNSNYSTIIDTWVGVDKELRDFQYDDWAVEVKTTSGNNKEMILVSNQRQLDDTLIDKLYLFHLSIDLSKGKGETLNCLIEKIRSLLSKEEYSQIKFNSKLIEAGYIEKQSYLYKDKFYQIRGTSFYHVYNNFPRIKENELRSGVNDVKYSISLSNCEDYLITERQLFNSINL